MGVKQQVEQHLGFSFSPLTVSPGITVQGNVPDVQQYDIAAGVYEPDYTLTNLVLVPSMLISDPDGILPEGNASLTNMKWTLYEGGVKTVITSADTGFAMAADGKLTVKRNCDTENPMTLVFEAEYLDPRTGMVYTMCESYLVRCEGVTERPVLSLDTSGIIAYDPVRDGEKTRKVKASLRIGGAEVAAANRDFVWQKRDPDGVWATIDGTDPMDYDVALSADKTELTVKEWLIGERIDIRCYAKYSPYGSPSSLAIDTRTPMETFSVVRVEQKLTGRVKGPKRLKGGTKDVKPELVVSDPKGLITNPDSVLDIEWRTSKNVAAGTVTKSAVVATGSKPTIPTSFIDMKLGGLLIPSFGVKEPLKAATTSDGKVLTDATGAVLLIR